MHLGVKQRTEGTEQTDRLFINYSYLKKADSDWTKPTEERPRKRMRYVVGPDTEDGINSHANPGLDDRSVSIRSLRGSLSYEGSTDSVQASIRVFNSDWGTDIPDATDRNGVDNRMGDDRVINYVM